MSEHPREHEELLERVFLGELGREAPEVRERLAACTSCRAEMEQLEQVRGDVSAALGQQRADLARARAQASAGDEAFVRRTLREVLPRTAPRASRQPLAFALVAAAAVVVSLLLWRRGPSSGEPPPEILLDGGSIPCLEPVGAVADYERFAWEFALPPGAHFELRIHAREEDGKGKLLHEQAELSESRWIPTADQRSSLPERIVWEVVVRGIDGRALERGQREAWRR